MIRKIVLVLILFSGMQVYCFAQSQAKSGQLIIQYENLKSSDGDVVVKLYNSHSPKYPDTKSAIAIKTVKIVNKQAKVTFDNLPYGKYAFTTFHDENSNGVMDTNMIHFPTEGYAFSNNLKIVFGPPSFEKASIDLTQHEMFIKVKLSY